MSLNPTEVSPLVWLVVLRASEYFYKGKNRYPGTNGVPCKIDAGDLFDRVKMLANETGVCFFYYLSDLSISGL